MRPPPVTLASVRDAFFQLTNTKTREPGAAAAVVVSVAFFPLALSLLAPRSRSKATAEVPPLPVSVTACGLSAASSSIVTLALRAPAARGVNVTEIVHVAFAASVAGATGQPFVCANRRRSHR